MLSTMNMIHSLVPITLFNRGQASKIFDRLKSERQLIVLKNNQTSAIILSPEEYERLSEIEENYTLLMEAQRRLEAHGDKPGIPESIVLEHLGLTQEEIDAAEDPKIE